MITPLDHQQNGLGTVIMDYKRNIFKFAQNTRMHPAVIPRTNDDLVSLLIQIFILFLIKKIL